jgi:hypothetical protein
VEAVESVQVDAVFPVESDPDELVSLAFFVSFFSELSLDELVLALESLLLESLLVSDLPAPPLSPYPSAYHPPPFRMNPAPPDTMRLAVA